MRLLVRSSLRWWRRHPLQVLLSLLGVALGVAVVIGIDLASQAAQRAFRLSSEALVGRATHHVVGATGSLDESVYTTLRVELGERASAPIVEFPIRVVLEGGRREPLTLLGLDPFAEAPFRDFLAVGGTGARFDVTTLLTEPGALVLSEGCARRLGVERGDTLRLLAEGREREAHVAGIVRPPEGNAREAALTLAFADLAVAQELGDLVGRLSRIELVLPEGPEGAARLERVRVSLPDELLLRPSGARTGALAEMTRAFRFNLRALSLLALIVGLFLIYNTITFAVVQRRELFGGLRALGVSRRQLLALVLSEIACVALAGSALGVLLGVGLGRVLLLLVVQTINDLYFALSVQVFAPAPGALLSGVALGIVATLLTGLRPAWEASSAPPRTVTLRSVHEERGRRGARIFALVGALGLLLGGALLAVPSRSLPLAFCGFAALLLAAALLAPMVTVLLSRAFRPGAARLFGVYGRLAARGIEASLSRTGVAIAALMTAIAVALAVGVMIDSFRNAVVRWLDASLAEDMYVMPPSDARGRSSGSFPASFAEELAALDGVRETTTVRGIDLPYGDTLVQLVTFSGRRESEERGPRGLVFLEGEPLAAWQAYRDDGALLATEPLAFRLGLGEGDVVSLPTDRGETRLVISGVVRSYSSDQGAFFMTRARYDALFDDDRVDGVGLVLAEEAEVASVEAHVRALEQGRELVVRTASRLRANSVEIFDRTFTVTSVMRFLAAFIAFLGVLSAQLAIQLERTRENGILRAVGMTPRGVRRLVLCQTGLMGFIAGLLALPTGWMMAAVMVHVINRRSFGWTMELELSPWLFLQALLASTAAALVAGFYPAWRLARSALLASLRDE